ncbi:unnamed protein product, partial [Symbiodinium microadriaticum]
MAGRGYWGSWGSAQGRTEEQRIAANRRKRETDSHERRNTRTERLLAELNTERAAREEAEAQVAALRGGSMEQGEEGEGKGKEGPAARDPELRLVTKDEAVCPGIPGLFYHAEAGRGYWILDSRPRQWLV